MRNRSHEEKLGGLIAKVLAGSWRANHAPLEISVEELDAVAPSLLKTGAGALAWQRVRDSALRSSLSASQFEQAYKMHALKAAIHEREIREVLTQLGSRGIEPVLVKGWAVARFYRHAGLRPYGDIDLCVGTREYEAARKFFESEEGSRHKVDLHRGFENLDSGAWDSLWSRSRVLEMKDARVRVLCDEDHLRLLCFHFLREGAWRPLWLCDVAVMIEERAAGFDWDLCLGQDTRRKEWIACTIALARKLLGANVEGVPAAACAERMPGWLLPSVLKAWAVRAMQERHKAPINSARRYPIYALKALPSHWPNPIEGTIGMNGSFNEWPRLPFQIGNCLARTTRFFLRLRKTRK